MRTGEATGAVNIWTSGMKAELCLGTFTEKLKESQEKREWFKTSDIKVNWELSFQVGCSFFLVFSERENDDWMFIFSEQSL